MPYNSFMPNTYNPYVQQYQQMLQSQVQPQPQLGHFRFSMTVFSLYVTLYLFTETTVTLIISYLHIVCKILHIIFLNF